MARVALGNPDVWLWPDLVQDKCTIHESISTSARGGGGADELCLSRKTSGSLVTCVDSFGLVLQEAERFGSCWL